MANHDARRFGCGAALVYGGASGDPACAGIPTPAAEAGDMVVIRSDRASLETIIPEDLELG